MSEKFNIQIKFKYILAQNRMYSLGPQNQESKLAMTPFELKSLAFADLIMAEADEEDTTPPEEIKKEVPPYDAIRCTCGNNQPTNREFCKCTICHSYLHRDCVDPVERNSPNYQCPICRLQRDGIDPFRDLKSWIGNVDGELRQLHKLVTEASNYDSQMYTANMGNEYQMQNVRARQGSVQSRNQINRIVNDMLETFNNLFAL